MGANYIAIFLKPLYVILIFITLNNDVSVFNVINHSYLRLYITALNKQFYM